MNTFIKLNTAWRTGVVLARGGNTALVKADLEERKICIYVKGNEHTRRDFLSVIRAELETVHHSLVGLDVREKVPLPENPQVVVDYEYLLMMEREGIDIFIPEGQAALGSGLQTASVRRLLNGVSTPAEREAKYNIIINQSQNISIGDDGKIDMHA